MDNAFLLRSQAKILADINVLMRNPGEAAPGLPRPRWSSAEIYHILNQSLLTWASKVRYPRVYTLIDGFASDVDEYVLPGYVCQPLFPQSYLDTVDGEASYISYGGVPQWNTYPGWEVDTAGAQPVLRISLGAVDAAGRVIYWPTNGPVPTTPVTLQLPLGPTDTDLHIEAEIDVPDVGWVKIGVEWLAYAGQTRDATTVLHNLEHGRYNTIATGHGVSDPVEWGIAVGDGRMYGQLYHQMQAFLHALFLTDGAEHERANHERMMSYFQDRAKQMLDDYAGAPTEIPLLLTRRGVGLF